MAGPLTIQDGRLVSQDSSEVLVYVMDYDAENLAAGVLLSGAGSFAITPAGMTAGSVALMAGSRKVQVLLSGGTVGKTYTVEHTVATNESPAQTKSKSFKVLIT